MDGERSRCLRLAHHVLCHTRVRAHISRDQTADLQGVVLPDLIPGSKQFLVYRMLSKTQKQWQTKTKAGVDQAVRGSVRPHESYLPFGRSPSSFFQRTVGTGSPRASHLNSTLWSTNTTWLLGRRTKLGRSAEMNKRIKDELHQGSSQKKNNSILHFNSPYFTG